MKNEKQEESPVKKHNLIKIICAAMLCALLAGALVGCSLKKQETVTIYPCYFNDDVAGMDAATIGAALEQAGWSLQESEQDGAYDNGTTYTYQLVEGESKKGIIIYEFATAEEAQAAYKEDGMNDYFPSGIFPADHSLYVNHLRISNCYIRTLKNSHVELMEILGLGTPQALEVPTENTQELKRKIKSVDIEAIKTEMEADGYTFYQMEFLAQEDSEDFVPTYLIISPAQDRAYLYTQALKPRFGISYTYFIYQILERTALDYEGEDIFVGMNFVGFMDGGCVLCYGDTFAEIEKYFAE